MAKVLGTLGRFCARHRFLVLGLWVLVIGSSVAALAIIGPKTTNDLSLPGTGSQAATDLLAAEFPPQQNGASPIVFHAASGQLTGSSDTKAISDSVKAILKVPHVYSAPDPTANPQAGLISADGTTAFSSVLLDVPTGDLTTELAQQVLDATAPAQKAGLQVAAGGSIGSTLSSAHSESSELVGILAAIVILTLTFGSLVAMGMPILLAISGLVVALGLVGMLGHLINMASTGPTLAIMIGLGVGIDYALFLVTRHRDNLRAGMAVRDSVATAVATSGSAVVFAGTTVVIALLSLSVAGIPLVTSLGYATAIAVFTAVLAAITLLPAMLSAVGPRINSLRLPRWLHPPPKPEGRGLWARWAGFVTGHRVLSVLIALSVLVPLIAPVVTLQLGQEDIGVTSESTTERKAFDWMSAAFGPGYNGPLLIAVSLSPAATASQDYTDQYTQANFMKSDLQSKQTVLQQRSDSLQSQQKQLEQQQASLQAQGDQLKQEQQQLEREQASLQQQQAQLEQQQASLESQKASLQQQQAQLQQQADQLAAEQQSLERQANRLRSEQAALENQAQQLRQERDNLRAERQALVAKTRSLTRELVQLERERVALRVKILRYEQELRIAPRWLKPRIEKIIANNKAKVASVDQQIAATKAELRRIPSEARSLARQAKVLGARAVRLAGEAVRLGKQALVLEQQAQQLQAQATSLQQQADQLNAEADSLKAQAAQLQSQADALKAQGAQLQQQGDALQQQADQLNAEAAQLQQQGAALQKQGNTLQAQQADAKTEQAQATDLQSQITIELTGAGGDERGTDPRLVRIQEWLATPDDVQLVTPPTISKSGTAATYSVIPRTRPADPATADLVVQMRNEVIPQALTTGVVAYVGGNTAANVDLANKIAQQLPLVIGVVLALSFLLLMIAFRSLLIPLQAAITNLLSVAAAFGVLTACFQWGWGLSLVGQPSPYGTVPIASYVPLMMFAALFGLSMDYEVFFVSSVQHYHAGGDDVRTSVRRGLAGSARVIVAAAIIMISVFGSFILTPDPTIKQFGVGLSVAVFLAGSMVILLAPAMLALFGRGTFWVPRWLGRILPHMDLEGPPPEAAAAPEAPQIPPQPPPRRLRPVPSPPPEDEEEAVPEPTGTESPRERRGGGGG